MIFEDKCRVLGCINQADKLGTDEKGNIIEMCKECWHAKYRL
jgi:hypothetical protein